MRSTARKTLLCATAILPTSLFAQGLTIQSTTDVHFYGGLGTLVSIASKFGGGGTLQDVATTKYLSGHKLRTESNNTANIIDVDAGRMINIDNRAKTYSSFTFDEMAEMMRRAEESAKKEREKEAAKPKKSAKEPKGDVKWKYKADVSRPGQRERIAGYNTERVFLTVTVEAEATPEGGDTEQVGSLVVLLDEWISKDAPQSAAMAEFSRAYAQKAGQAFKSQAQALQAAFVADPRMKDGMEAASKELAKIQGVSLRSTMYFTVVPAGLEFNRALALNEVSASLAKDAKDDKAKPDDKPKGGGFGGLVGKIKAAAEEANKQEKSGDKKNAAPPKQETIATLKDEVSSITSGPISADLFAAPVGYREVKRQMPPSN